MLLELLAADPVEPGPAHMQQSYASVARRQRACSIQSRPMQAAASELLCCLIAACQYRPETRAGMCVKCTPKPQGRVSLTCTVQHVHDGIYMHIHMYRSTCKPLGHFCSNACGCAAPHALVSAICLPAEPRPAAHWVCASGG
jgi:hypothetical protein